MRLPLLLCCLASPALGWEVSNDGATCHLLHQMPDGAVHLSYAPVNEEFSITLTRFEPWESDDVFAIKFDETRPIFITTDRHQLTPDRTGLTVTDRGFGNVLDGLQYNEWAIAATGQSVMIIPLTHAADAVQSFRECSDAQTI